jgi:hypothetical protein
LATVSLQLLFDGEGLLVALGESDPRCFCVAGALFRSSMMQLARVIAPRRRERTSFWRVKCPFESFGWDLAEPRERR